MLKPPTLKDNPKIRRQPPQKKKITIQKNKITSMFPAKPDASTNGDVYMQVQKAVFRNNSQMPDSTELKNAKNLIPEHQGLPGKPDLAANSKLRKLSLPEKQLGSKGPNQTEPDFMSKLQIIVTNDRKLEKEAQ